jgi:hypothetical protein
MIGAYAEPAAAELAAAEEQQTVAGRVVDYLRSRWGAFLDLEVGLLDLAHRAAVVSATLNARGDLVRAALAREAVERLAELRALHDRAVRMFDQVRDGIPSLQGLGAVPFVPLALVGIVLALGAMVAFIFTRAGAEDRIVQLLEAGTLTPDQAERLLAEADQPSPGESFTSSIKWIMGGVLALMLLKTVREFR